jgi:hypothetical protein
MVELESKVSGTAQEDEAVEIDDGIVEMITEASMPQDYQRGEDEGSIYAPENCLASKAYQGS